MTRPAWTKALFASALEPAGAGVWRIADDRSTATISDQFKANAGDYHARYAASGHFAQRFREALAGVSLPQAPAILDLGSGSGVNSVAPLLEIFPDAKAVATDLSGELLAILAHHAEQTAIADQVLCVVMDAMGQDVAPAQFDLVTGVAILHHLVHPAQGIAAAARALKPGGQAIFMEPFDGYGLIRLAYERILAEASLRGETLDPEIERTLQAMITDIAVRGATDPNGPGLEALDDKWLFSREHLERMGRDAGFAQVRFVAHHSHATLYRDMANVQIRLSTGRDDLALPDWATEIMDGFDNAMPGSAKRQMMLEGTVVLTKAAAPEPAPRKGLARLLGLAPGA